MCSDLVRASIDPGRRRGRGRGRAAVGRLRRGAGGRARRVPRARGRAPTPAAHTTRAAARAPALHPGIGNELMANSLNDQPSWLYT